VGILSTVRLLAIGHVCEFVHVSRGTTLVL